jgi:hypothetical protein
MELQKLILAEDIFDALECGKKCTIRNGRRDIKLGHLLFESLDFKRTEVVNINTIIYTELQNVPNDYVINDGFKSHEDMCQKMRRFYPDIQLNTECTVIVFDKFEKE